jgi:hypothetical protein
VQHFAKDGDNTAWKATRFSWSGDVWGHGLWERRAISDKGEFQRQRKLCRVGLRGPAVSSTDSEGDVRERLPWLALAWVIADPDVSIAKVHKALYYELNMDDRRRRLADWNRENR